MVESGDDQRAVSASYHETETERQVHFEAGSKTAVIAQPKQGYAMVIVRRHPDGDELERYYGFDMAIDHAAEVLGVSPSVVPIPDEAADFGI